MVCQKSASTVAITVNSNYPELMILYYTPATQDSVDICSSCVLYYPQVIRIVQEER